MRLKQIKLAGFKSFVDPTKIPLPNPLSAIIGPNGCGKSNIIDAVRWVLGESSAKHLRGDSMVDVIFNGSTARRPVSVASVELLFDNQDNRLAGEYASYQEIAIKRQVSRDGDSNYFLNNQKCRRKDITDLFMGTGLGPRSYAIIEQGTISRLIESKPQELRVFIEEAAGISRYKERRRETENRIRHTRENLSRLGDIRSELGKQLERLAEQAQTAKQYRELKQSERQCESELVVSRYHELNQQIEGFNLQIGKLEVQQASLLAEKQTLELSLTELSLQLSELDSREHEQVEAFYLSKTHIAKLEQSMKHREQQNDSLNQRLREITKQVELHQTGLHSDSQTQTQLKEQQQQSQPEMEGLQHQVANESAQLVQATQRNSELSEQFQLDSSTEAKAHLAVEMNRSKLNHSVNEFAQKQKLVARLTEKAQQLNEKLAELKANALTSQCDTLMTETEGEQEVYDELSFNIETRQSASDALKIELESVKVKLADEKGRLSVVSQLLPNENDIACTQLWQVIEVTPGWERSVDLLLSNVLNSPVLLDDVTEITTGFNANPMTNHVINTPVNLQPWLSQVKWLETKDEAIQQRTVLAEHEMFATADGYLVGADFIVEKTAESSSLVQLKNEYSALIEAVDNTENNLSSLTQALSKQAQELEPLVTVQQQKHQQIQAQKVILAGLQSQVKAMQHAINDTDERHKQLLQELTETSQEQQQLSTQKMQLQQDALALQHTFEQAQKRKQTAETDKLAASTLLNKLKALLSSSEQSLKTRLKTEQTTQTQLALIGQKVNHQQQRLEELEHNEKQVLAQLGDKESGSANHNTLPIKTQLAQALEVQQVKQQALSGIRQQQAGLQERCDSAGANKKQQLVKIEDLTQNMSTLKLRREGLKGQIDSQFSLINEQGIDVEQVLLKLDANRTTLWRQKELERLRARIVHLGAINLAAIEEFDQQNERKSYLDSQDEDLNSALSSLEEAIRKIDTETKSKFKDTFEKVNKDLGILFPKVFGGGSAYLALTGDDLLETGVTIMARPPGKKNSTIHLLSGGEKALTALSLVFAIFRLNPAPFCMLDEVDAPLDDANVERFCRLVKEMSQSVQFIYISHNKITMELADQLIGVTMHEPGVSRIVAVDIDEAVALADAG
ncbi:MULTISPECIES: chromosome segregation protein SMC [unclassified Shewanella]|uniref:chromosome segregation protein SMC n=1 Tax=unclassified Shewanella TaxID=196818 RepID=UPI000C7C3D5F|nr:MULTISPECIES: chromosome segregation protein SMC [unclassified Shewanella]PKG57815.1 chromosome segregation protein SMC [Shewanella sp. GutDb-MelDb]PKG74198.1 chromosome segregation protein SMC [Shewanella sp. GutCb]